MAAVVALAGDRSRPGDDRADEVRLAPFSDAMTDSEVMSFRELWGALRDEPTDPMRDRLDRYRRFDGDIDGAGQ